MSQELYIDIYCRQQNHHGERICGDVFLSARIKEEKRIVAVLSDGMGHGVKANVLATLTATMLLNFTKEHKDFEQIAAIITKTLPVCSKRKTSYATFTAIDISYDGTVNILEYDNPACFIVRDGEVKEIEWQHFVAIGMQGREMKMRHAKFKIQKYDRVVFYGDGITQSGLGTKFTEGWERQGLMDFVLDTLRKNPELSADALAGKIVNKAIANDDYHAKDDCSCGVIYFREPRGLLLCTGPPFQEDSDAVFAGKLKDFQGTKIISGATTADIISRELKTEIEDETEFYDPELPPASHMPGVDLITEGMLTLNKVIQLLKKYDSSTVFGKGPADRIASMILGSDEIHLLVGTKINEAHQDPSLPVELDIRRNVIKRLIEVLEKKFLKEVRVEYL
jgi:hypothetical protein